MSGNDEDQNIINGEIPKVSRYNYKKQGTNYSRNKNNKELDRTELKLKINSLALQLLNEKAINKPLANKMAKLVLKGTRKQTLEDAFNNLQKIKYNWRTGKQGDEKRPLKNKNYTIKELKTLNEDAKKEYNVYRKYRLWGEDEKESTNDDEKPKKPQIRNITTTVKGLHNIKNVIEDDLKYFQSFPYIFSVDVLQVTANKIEQTDKTYRWLGWTYDKNKSEVIYHKAWNANKNLFQYKAYNMDPNNETPLECVPNALFKMYGDKSKGKTYYNGKIANGGMEYVKYMLDIGGETAYLDCIDGEEPQIIDGKKGYSPMDILNFCNDHKIRCFGYDWMMKEFISNKDLCIDFHSNLPAFVFYFNDHHIYLINDKDVRHALLNCNKTVDVTALAKEKKQKIFTKDLWPSLKIPILP